MNRLKKIAICTIVAALSLSTVACKEEIKKEEVVIATVNGRAIYQEDYETLMEEYLNYFGGGEEATTYLSSQKALLLEELVTNEVLLQKAEALEIECTAEEVEEAYASILEQYGSDTVAEMLEFSKMSEATYKELLEEQIVLGKLEEIMIEGEITISDEALQKNYEDHIADYTIGEGANMKHILVVVPEEADEQEIAAAELAVKQIQEELQQGKPFEEIYEQYGNQSSDESLYIVEDLGFVQYEEPNFDEEFLEGVKQVGEGEVSQPIKSSFGYHFVKVDGIAKERVIPFEEVKGSIYNTLLEEQQYDLYTACLDKWREEAKVITYEERIK